MRRRRSLPSTRGEAACGMNGKDLPRGQGSSKRMVRCGESPVNGRGAAGSREPSGRGESRPSRPNRVIGPVVVLLFVLFCAGGIALGGKLTARDLRTCPACFFCGMDRKCFAYSRVFIRYDDRSTLGACSINCAALDLAKSIDKTPVKLLVGDYNNRSLIDAEKAVWTIGGDKPGVMSERAKWAFASKSDAEEYIRKHGGVLAGFDEVMEATYLDIYREMVK